MPHPPPRLGYPCMNLVLDAGTNGTLRLAFLADVDKLRGVVEANFANLERILPWNAAHGVRLFRLGSQFIPFASHERFPYDWRAEHAARLAALGRLARSLGQRLSMHPGQYVVPASPQERIVRASIAELRYAADVLRLMGMEEGVIVIHVGGAYGDKPDAARRFVRALGGEADVLRYLALENDERTWAADEVLPIAEALSVPAIIDTLHHRLNPGALSLPAAIARSIPTWRGRRPKLHISSQDPDKVRGAHAYGIDDADWRELLAAVDDQDVDVMIESKGKEQSLRTLGLGAIPPLANAAAACSDDESESPPSRTVRKPKAAAKTAAKPGTTGKPAKLEPASKKPSAAKAPPRRTVPARSRSRSPRGDSA